MIEIRRATLDDIPEIQRMAYVVFPATYAHILSSSQIEYMLDWMYSAPSLTTQIAAPGKDFFLAIDDDGTAIAYVSIEEESISDQGVPQVHLQKLYVMPDHRGRGLGSRLVQHVFTLLRQRFPQGCRLALNVNRQNDATAFYQKMHMRRDCSGDFDIGNGYFMNDYIYTIDLKGTDDGNPQGAE